MTRLGVGDAWRRPATVERLAAMAAHADRETLKGKRDRSLLLLGFASAMRRSELVALDVADLVDEALGELASAMRESAALAQRIRRRRS